MLKEVFIGKHLSHFKINNSVKAFIISESFFWSAWNFIAPIFAIFVIRDIKGGNIEIVATAYSLYLVIRIIFELISGRLLLDAKDFKKYIFIILGMLIISCSYLGFLITKTIFNFYLFYALIGIGFGLASPAKFSLFTDHLDKGKGVAEWGIYDAVALIGMALAASLGGFIAKIYGFQILFLISAFINFVGIIPYLLFMGSRKSSNL
ncbi:MAG: MFS transporter [Candidatus Levyibacteriota bacterium]